MSNWIRSRSAAVMFVLVVGLMLAGCSGKKEGGGNSKATKENGDKLKDGKAEKDVIDFLGEPSEKKETDYKHKQFIWKNGNDKIAVYFNEKGKSVSKSMQIVTVK